MRIVRISVDGGEKSPFLLDAEQNQRNEWASLLMGEEGLAMANPSDLAISKTGQRLAYTHLFHDMNIWRVDLTGARLKNAAAFIKSTGNEFPLSYSTDGKRIAFESNRFGNEEIWVPESQFTIGKYGVHFMRRWMRTR